MDLPPPPDVPGDPKDWTWVLDRVCPECGFDVRDLPRDQVGNKLRLLTRHWLEVLSWDEERLRHRPEPTVWSPLEYSAHVRDVFALYSERLRLMIDEDGPHYPNWDQDITAREKRYDLADPMDVARELAAYGHRLADEFDSIEDWTRTGFRSDGAAFTIESFARYFLHDPAHHLHDVGVEASRLR